MKIITCASYYGTGSSAVTDYLSEFDNIFSLMNTEFRFVQDPDGISELEYNLVENFNRHNSGHALKRYKKLVDFYSWKLLKGNYDRYLNGKWKELSYKYIDELTDFKYHGWWMYDLYDRGRLYYFYKRFVNKILHLTIWSNNPDRQYNNMQNEWTYCSHPTEEKFLQCTKKYIDALFNEVVGNANMVMVDQIVPPTNLERHLRYFNDIQVFVVDRDPRDIFLLDKYVWKDGLLPNDAELFCKWFKYTRGHRKYENLNTDKIKFIQFEDLIYRYDETTSKICQVLNLVGKNHVYPFKYLDPKVSIKNTQMWMRLKMDGFRKNEVAYIEKELREYLYKF